MILIDYVYIIYNISKQIRELSPEKIDQNTEKLTERAADEDPLLWSGTIGIWLAGLMPPPCLTGQALEDVVFLAVSLEAKGDLTGHLDWEGAEVSDCCP